MALPDAGPTMSHRPSYDEFAALAAGFTAVPVYRELTGDTLTPVSAFGRIAGGHDRAFLFESVVGGERIGRYSFLGAGPFRTFEAINRRVETRAESGPVHIAEHGDPLKALEDEIARYRAPHVPGLPRFCGGAVGYAGYDTVRYIERLPNAPPDDRGIPDLSFGFYDTMIVFDHLTKTIKVVAHGRVRQSESMKAAYAEATTKVDAIVEQLKRPSTDLDLTDIDVFVRDPRATIPNPRVTSNFTRSEFEAAVRTAKEYIAAGDAFQIVLSQRFRTETTAAPFDIYRALRVVNPSPFMFFVKAGEVTLVGASPEIMCRVDGRGVVNRPLAGTRRRGATPEEDATLAAELSADPKERAEHVMLVDLARNDVGRVAEVGSVKIENLLAVERYSHVMHLSSTVTGTLKENLTAFDALRASLPAGTLSGAPKVRAMEIIDELEP